MVHSILCNHRKKYKFSGLMTSFYFLIRHTTTKLAQLTWCAIIQGMDTKTIRNKSSNMERQRKTVGKCLESVKKRWFCQCIPVFQCGSVPQCCSNLLFLTFSLLESCGHPVFLLIHSSTLIEFDCRFSGFSIICMLMQWYRSRIKIEQDIINVESYIRSALRLRYKSHHLYKFRLKFKLRIW